MNNYIPCNRYLRLLPYEDKNEDEGLLVPKEMLKKKQEEFSVWKIAGVSKNANNESWKVGQTVIVDASTVMQVPFKGETLHLVAENYVVMVVEENVVETKERKIKKMTPEEMSDLEKACRAAAKNMGEAIKSTEGYPWAHPREIKYK